MTETAQRSVLGLPLGHAAGVGAIAVAFYSAWYAVSAIFGLPEFIHAVGIRPLTWEGVNGTVLYTLGHTTLTHLVVNMVPLLILTTAICYLLGWRIWLGTTILIAVSSGWFCFLAGNSNTLIVGASGITAGLGVYLFFVAPFRRAFYAMVIGGVFTGVTFISIVSALTVGETATSWEAHVGGVLAGIILACITNLKRGQNKEEEPLPLQAGTPRHP